MVTYSFTLATLEYFLIVFIRVASYTYAAPFLSMRNVPNKVKVGFSLVFSMLLFQALPRETLVYETVLDYAAIVIKEAAIGLSMGLVTNICLNIITFAGRIIDMEIGLSMASMFDPLTRENSSITGTMYNYMLMLLLMMSNLHHYIIQAFADAYTLIPINYADLRLDNVYLVFLQYVVDSVILSFRIVLPFFCATLILNVVLGILAKVAPQMNMFAVGIQMKVLVGLLVMFLTVSLLPTISDMIFTEIRVMMVAVIEAMR